MAKNGKKKYTPATPVQEEIESTNKHLSNIAHTKIEQSLKDFSKIGEQERIQQFGSDDFFEQFWEFFKKEQHPNLLDEIESQEALTIYVQNLEKKGFSLKNLVANAKELHKEFKETLDEKTTIEKSLKELQDYCDKPQNKMPAHIFHDFAHDIGLETSPHISVVSTTKIYKIGQVFSVWNIFLENAGIILKDQQKSDVEKFLCPPYLATERLLTSATIKKIKKNLPDSLVGDFEAQFPLPIDIHSSFQNLEDFQRQRLLFLDMHKTDIDTNLAKKLDNMLVSNADIYKELTFEGETIEWTRGFSEQSKNFRRMFNGLVSRQLFDEAREKGSYVDNYLDIIGKEFKEFPPYFNELFALYPYRHQEVILGQAEFQTQYTIQEQLLKEKEEALNTPLPEGEKNKTADQWREECLQAVLVEKEKLNTIKRKAYANYLTSKDKDLGKIVDTLVDHGFDMNSLEKKDQQKIVNILVEKKLGDSIKNQIPTIFGLDSHEYESFIKELFDLEKKDIVIPTQYGDIPLHFLEKNFFGGPSRENMEISPTGVLLTERKNLPLNFKVAVTEQNRSFFENNVVFDGLFGIFNNQVKINDSYKVSVKNTKGQSVQGYLSQTPPSDEISQDIENKKYGNGWFLYSQPITQSTDTRTLVTWDGSGDPVVIPDGSESSYEVDVLSRELNLNGEAIGAVLFSHILGKRNLSGDLSPKQEQALAKKFGKIEKDSLYYDSYDMKDSALQEQSNNVGEDKDKDKEKEEQIQGFIDSRNAFQGYSETAKKEKSPKEEIADIAGSRLLIRGVGSNFPPSGNYQYFNMDIDSIDTKKGVFTIKLSGNETDLGKFEGVKRSYPLSREGLQVLKDAFDAKYMWKLPKKESISSIDDSIQQLGKIGLGEISSSFDGVHWDGRDFMIDMGKESGQKVTHFGLIESIPGEDNFKESKSGYMYQIEHDADKRKFIVTANDEDKTKISLDYPNFLLFVADRKLQPKTEKSSQGIDLPSINGPSAVKQGGGSWKGYSIASIIGLFKNFKKKIGDGIKKYEEDQIEELTDDIFYQGKLFHKLAAIMPTTKLQEAFGNAGDEYMEQRDSKTWKKIEKYLKRYESDPDFGGDYMWGENIKPLLEGKKPFKDHHQAAAILLATIKKGKGPYSRNTDWAGKGKWIKILFGEGHQRMYLTMKEKLERELQQGYKINGQTWADDLQDEILKLEMKYITHCIDGRHLAYRPDVPKLEAMYSKKYAGELETEANKFFSETASGSTKEKGYSFDLARFEFFRLLADRPQQALPCLKQMAVKATTDSQWKVFQSAVLTGMLSGAFYNITQDDKGYIKKICRTIGFLPGLWIKDPNHHLKADLFIKIATGKNPKYAGGQKDYDGSKFTFGKGVDLQEFKDVAGFDGGVNQWLMSGGYLTQIADFAGMKGKNFQGKTVIDLLNDPKTPAEWIPILKELEKNSLEEFENIDPDVKNNMHGLKQNIFAKSQSLIDKITDFSGGRFKGKDDDEIQGMQTAWKEIAHSVPREKLDDKNQVIYILKKFMNRFEGRGFNVEEKRFLVRGLLTTKEELKKGNTQSADDMLWYMIVGNVIKSSGSGQAPGELVAGMEAFKDFFKANLDTILEKEVIEQGWDKDANMGKMFVQQLDKGPYKVMNWDTCVDLEENKAFFGNNKEEREKRNNDRRSYNMDQIYINKRLYALARGIDNRNFIPNKFKEFFGNTEKKSTKEQLHETLKSPKDLRIKNPEIIDKTKRRLSGQLLEGMSDEEMATAMEDEYTDLY